MDVRVCFTSSTTVKNNHLNKIEARGTLRVDSCLRVSLGRMINGPWRGWDGDVFTVSNVRTRIDVEYFVVPSLSMQIRSIKWIEFIRVASKTAGISKHGLVV